MLQYKIKPEHVNDEFFDVLSFITNKRVKAKKSKDKKDKITAETLKITINSMFGLLNFPNYWLYDPKAALSVTINAQMFLLMLIEDLELNGFEVISANTDGITTIVPKDKKELYDEICMNWQKYLGINLSFKKYLTYIRRDINNYCVLQENMDIKAKGIFVIDQNLEKGYNTTIIPKALQNYFFYNIPIEKTVKGSIDIFDFCLSEKTGSQFQVEYHYLKDNEKRIDLLQKTNRYFISNKGGTLLKRKDIDSISNIALGWNTTILNNYSKDKLEEYLNNINHSYYIAECNKIIEQIEDKQLTLW